MDYLMPNLIFSSKGWLLVTLRRARAAMGSGGKRAKWGKDWNEAGRRDATHPLTVSDTPYRVEEAKPNR
jgi:hypothetical protein